MLLSLAEAVLDGLLILFTPFARLLGTAVAEPRRPSRTRPAAGDQWQGGWLWGLGDMGRRAGAGTFGTVRDGTVDSASLKPNSWPCNPSLTHGAFAGGVAGPASLQSRAGRVLSPWR